MGHATAEQRALLDSPEVASRSLLERMGLPTGAIRNIIMHRDIVPRAFACDYTLVADLLARVGDGFREHGCLQNPHGRQVSLLTTSDEQGIPHVCPAHRYHMYISMLMV